MRATARFDPEALRKYAAYYGRLDPWVRSAAAKGLLRTGGMGLGDSLVPSNEYHKGEFYNDFGREYGFRSGFSIIIRLDQNVAAALSVTEHGRAFGEPELTLASRLLPHLQRALDIHERLAGLADQRSAAEAVIDRLPFGVVFVDAGGRAVLVNRTAQGIFDTHDGLTLRAKHLNAANLSQTNELRALVARAIAASRGDGVGSGGAIPIGRPSGKRALQVLVTPLRTARTKLHLTSTACAAVFVSDPEVQLLTDELLLRQFYGFTPAEARIALQLLQHQSVEEAAEALEISLNTARTHLKRLFEKTNTRRQSELVRLLVGGVGQLHR